MSGATRGILRLLLRSHQNTWFRKNATALRVDNGYNPNILLSTACDTPDGYLTPGGPPRTGDDNGTIAPTCVLVSIEYTPTESLQFANAFYVDHPEAWGRYGWSNGIDLGMKLLGIENYQPGCRTSCRWPARS